MSSNSGSIPGDVFDVKKVRKFIELMNEHDLAEIDLRQGDQRIRLRRGPETMTVSAMPYSRLRVPRLGSQRRQRPEASEPPSEEVNGPADPQPDGRYVLRRGESGVARFVKVGDRVGPETTVCIVEAMKVFNEIPAECAGRIVAVLAQSGDPVEFNQPLFRVEPS